MLSAVLATRACGGQAPRLLGRRSTEHQVGVAGLDRADDAGQLLGVHGGVGVAEADDVPVAASRPACAQRRRTALRHVHHRGPVVGGDLRGAVGRALSATIAR